MAVSLDSILKKIDSDQVEPVYLVGGDLVAAAPQATRLAEAVAKKRGCEVETHRRPPSLATLFADLRTFSLFAESKVVLAIDTAILADAKAAADLVDQAAEAIPKGGIGDGELDSAGREGASRLMQALRVFGTSPAVGDPGEAIESLPKWAFQGGAKIRRKKPRGRNAKDALALKKDLAALLEAGRRSGLHGFAEGDLAELGELSQGAMPDGHCLILAESSIASDHPITTSLTAQGALISVATVESSKGGDWTGLAGLVEELERETGVGIAPNALRELARRTLRGSGKFRDKSAKAESTAHLAGEYRKLASIARGQQSGRIDAELVAKATKDRGEEDVWQILDAVGQGRGGEAVARYLRMIQGADDTMRARLSFFSLLASFCRQLSSVAGMARLERVPPGVQSYNQFKSQWAPKLQAEPPQGGKNPLAGLHPFRLHKAYLAASRVHRDELPRLPWRVLETEMRIKGDASDADAAIVALISHLVASRL